jgi:hypothetical protein
MCVFLYAITLKTGNAYILDIPTRGLFLLSENSKKIERGIVVVPGT